MNTVFLNGKFMPAHKAKVSIFDTGFYFGDGIYEVALLCERRIVDLESHLNRLEYVLKQVAFNHAPTKEKISKMVYKLAKRNSHISNGLIYIQITRGVMECRYDNISDIQTPTVLAYIINANVRFNVKDKLTECLLIEEPRRYRRDIKMTSLMPANLAKLEAYDKGFNYVIFKDRETEAITEGVSSNLFIVTQNDEILTHPTGMKILDGCTRKKAIEFLENKKYKVKEEEFFEEDLINAKEAFLTGAIKLFAPIVKVNGNYIGNGEFKIAQFCTDEYKEFINKHEALVE
jgi:D-alanine transaminase